MKKIINKTGGKIRKNKKKQKNRKTIKYKNKSLKRRQN
jgi:hypothetical protein